MTEPNAQETPARAPWHFWVVVVLGLLWNGFGVYDFSMTQLRGEDYLRDFGMTEAQIAYFNGMPVWMHVVWLLGVGGALVGTVLLLLRSRWAFEVFAVSFAAFIVSVLYQQVWSNGGEVMGPQSLIMSAVIAALCIFFIWYAWAMRRRGLLR